MTAPIRLAQRAHDALRVLSDNAIEKRIKQLEAIEERGFALLLSWNQIETALKLMRYEEAIKDGWPETLRFLSTWTPLHAMKKISPEKYGLVLGSSTCSLWKTRNRIAHEGHNVPVDNYREYLVAALWVISELQKQIPTLESLRVKKHHSDVQLKN